MQRCEKCGSQKILENDVPTCIFCFGKQSVVSKTPVVLIDDPGEAALATLSSKMGVAKFDKSANTSITKTDNKLTIATGNAKDALAILTKLPMPKDVKEFRKIQKIIKLLEELVGENNDNRSI